MPYVVLYADCQFCKDGQTTTGDGSRECSNCGGEGIVPKGKLDFKKFDDEFKKVIKLLKDILNEVKP